MLYNTSLKTLLELELAIVSSASDLFKYTTNNFSIPRLSFKSLFEMLDKVASSERLSSKERDNFILLQ